MDSEDSTKEDSTNNGEEIDIQEEFKDKIGGSSLEHHTREPSNTPQATIKRIESHTDSKQKAHKIYVEVNTRIEFLGDNGEKRGIEKGWEVSLPINDYRQVCGPLPDNYKLKIGEQRPFDGRLLIKSLQKRNLIKHYSRPVK